MLALLIAVGVSVLLAPLLWSGNDRKTHLDQVLERGTLVMLTRNGASTYYIGPDGETGPEYERVRAFAEALGVNLEVKVADRFASLAAMLDAREGDLIAANLTRTPGRADRFRFGPDLESAQIEAVYRRGERRPRSLAELVDLDVAVIAGSSYEEALESAREKHPELRWAAREVGIDEMLQAVSEGEIDVTLVDSNILAANRPFYPKVRRAFVLDQALPQAWAFSLERDGSLAERAAEFLEQAQQDGTLAAIRDRFEQVVMHQDQVGMQQFLRQVEERLPPLLPMFKQVAEELDLDWRLLAALGYQESHWDPAATSRTGVRGVMMLTRRTANAMGVDDRLDPRQSIEGGAQYFKRMIDSMPERIPEPDRTLMALAAYNMGWGHLEDARVLTQKRGGDPDAWEDVRESLPLLTQEQWYKQTRYGYARGHEALAHVRNIRSYYDILQWMDTRAHPLLVAQLTPRDSS